MKFTPTAADAGAVQSGRITFDEAIPHAKPRPQHGLLDWTDRELIGDAIGVVLVFLGIPVCAVLLYGWAG